MRCGIIMGLCLLFSAAISMPRAEEILLERQDIAPNWVLKCREDLTDATKSCTLSRFGRAAPGAVENIPFHLTVWLFQTHYSWRFWPGLHNYPGREPTLRVDRNTPADSAKSCRIYREMQSGTLLRARYHKWPTGPQDMQLDLTGFGEAAAILESTLQRLAPADLEISKFCAPIPVPPGGVVVTPSGEILTQ